MTDTSLVFNLVARDRASAALGSLKEKFKSSSAAIGAAMGVGVGAAVATSLDMSSANSKLAAQLGVGSAEAGKLATVSANVYKNAWGTSTSDVDDAIRSVYQNIGDSSAAQGGLEGVTSKVLALRDTFNVDLGETTAAVGQMMKTGLAKNSTEAMDIITAGLQKGADKSGDFLATLNEYGTQFRKVGVSGQMATGLITQGLKAGARDGDLVADSIKEFSIRAIDGSKTTAGGFKAIGLNAGDMASRIGKGGSSANQALDLTLDKLRGMHDPVKQAAAATALFGTQSEDLGKALFALDPSSAVGALGKVGGAADKMAKTVGDNPAAALETFKRTAIVAVSDVAGKFIGFAMQNKAVFGPMAGLLGGVALAVVAVSVAEKVYNAGKTIGTVVTKIWNASIWESNAALLANPMTWVVIGIIALIAVIVIIATKTTWFQTAWKAMTAGVAVAWNWVWNLLKQGFALLTMLFLNFTGPGLIIHHWETIKHATSTAWNAVWGFVKAIPGRIVSLFLNWTLPGLIIKHWGAIKSGTIRVATATISWVRGLPGRIGNALSSLGGTIGGLASRAWNSFRSNVVSRATSAVTWVRGLPGRIRGALGSLGSLLSSQGRNVVQGLWSGISSMGGWIKSKIMGWAKSVIPGPIAKALGINSPSKVTRAQGLWVGRGLVDGLIGSVSQVRKASLKLADIVRGAMAPGKARNAALGIISGDTARLVAFANQQTTVAGKLKTAQTKLADLQKSRTELVNSVKQSIMSAADITQGMGTGEAGGADAILQRLKQDVGAAQAFAGDLNKLRKAGVDKDLIAQIASAGVAGGAATAAALANAGTGQIKAINDQQKALRTAAGSAGTAAGDAMYASGIHAAEGLVKGLKSQEKAIENAMLRIAKSMSKAIRKALKINSPSGLMADEVGAFVPPGVMAGVTNATPRMEADLQRWAAATVTGSVRSGTAMSAPRAGAAPMTTGRGGAAPIVLEFRSNGSKLGDVLVKLLREEIRIKGGNVQKALGGK